MTATRRGGLGALLAAAAAALAPAPSARPARAQGGGGGDDARWVERSFQRPGVPTPRFRASGGTVLVEGPPGALGMVVRPLGGAGAGCLAWRWRVDEGPPPTDLAARPGDDRALCVWVGFDGFPPGVTLAQRAGHAWVSSRDTSGLPLPRASLGYAFGGFARPPAFFASPSLGGLGMVRVLRPASLPQGRPFEERVDLAADWRAAFGTDAPPPPLLELAVSTDGDDTRSRVVASVEGLRLGPSGGC